LTGRRTITPQILEAVSAADKVWRWYVGLGVALILLGTYAMWTEGVATIGSIIVLGAVVLTAGIAQIVGGFAPRGAGHVMLLLLVAALDGMIGLILRQIWQPELLTAMLMVPALSASSAYLDPRTLPVFRPERRRGARLLKTVGWCSSFVARCCAIQRCSRKGATVRDCRHVHTPGDLRMAKCFMTMATDSPSTTTASIEPSALPSLRRFCVAKRCSKRCSERHGAPQNAL